MFLWRRKPLCDRVRGKLSEYLDNRLEGADRDAVERHIETCAACSEELGSLRMTVQLLSGMPEVQAPRSFAVRESDVGRAGLFMPQGVRVLRPAAAFAAAVLEPRNLLWLRPATAAAVIALVLVLMLDLFQVVPQGGEVVMSTYQPTYDVSATREMGESDLVHKDVPSSPENGFLGVGANVSVQVEDEDWDGNYSPPAPVAGLESGEGGSVAVVPEPGGEGDYYAGPQDALVRVIDEGEGWPMLETEIAIAAVTVGLLVIMLLVLRRRSTWGGV